MLHTKHITLSDATEQTLFTIPAGYTIHIVYIFAANHGVSTNQVSLWWETGGVDQMYFFDSTSIGAGGKETIGGQNDVGIFVLHNGDVVKTQASSSTGQMEVAVTFKLLERSAAFNNFNGS
jgi:hypothetical protein